MRKFIKSVSIFFLGIITTSAQNYSYKFNFGSKSEIEFNNFIQVDSKTIFSSERKYGLLTEDTEEFKINKKWVNIIPEIALGIKSSSEIRFKTDIEPGEYYLEINLNDSNTGHWHGELSVNDSIIVDKLYSFTSDPESDEASNYWYFIQKVTMDSDNFIFSVKAKNQPATLCALSLITKEKSEIQLIDRKITADKIFLLQTVN